MSYWPANKRHAKTSFGGLTRSELMSRVRSSRNVTTEIRLLGLLRSARVSGWRRNSRLQGKPDFVFPRSKLVVFVDGCFWHGHNCKRNLTPKRNVRLWEQKIHHNQRRDRQVSHELRSSGWRVIRIWECSLRQERRCVSRIVAAIRKSADMRTH